MRLLLILYSWIKAKVLSKESAVGNWAYFVAGDGMLEKRKVR